MSGRIVGVAIRQGGTVYSAPLPNRHHHLLHEAPERYRDDRGEQGFIDASGDFLTREEAEVRARKCGQLTKPIIGGVLTSEDLW